MKRGQREIQIIESHCHEISICQGALETLGDLMHRSQIDAALECLTPGDLEGLGLAVRGLGHAIGVELGNLQEVMEDVAMLLDVLQGVKQ